MKNEKSIVIIALNTRLSIACYIIRADQETIQVSHLVLLLDKDVASTFTFIKFLSVKLGFTEMQITNLTGSADCMFYIHSKDENVSKKEM